LVVKPTFEFSRSPKGSKWESITIDLVNISMPPRTVHPAQISAVVRRKRWLPSRVIDLGKPVSMSAMSRSTQVDAGDTRPVQVSPTTLLDYFQAASPGVYRVRFVVRDETGAVHRSEVREIDRDQILQVIAQQEI
jgi:hypothetical protein